MPRTLTSPVPAFPGTVVIPERMTLPQALTWERSLQEQQDLYEKIQQEKVEKIKLLDVDRLVIPALCEFVQEWHIENFPESVSIDTFPVTPRVASHKFIDWLNGEIRQVYLGEDIKNE